MATPFRKWDVNKRPSSGGAKEGLEKKMQYWNDKDYQYEFGVSVGAALNIAAQLTKDISDIPNIAKEIFRISLAAKLDPFFITSFDNYF